MVLDLTQVEANSDSPEVRALKVKVEEVARRYAKKHNWCSVVDKALAECGITPEPEQRVAVTTSLGLTFKVPTRLSTLVGLDEEEQRAVFADLLNGTAIASGSSGTIIDGTLNITPESITDLSLVDATVAAPTAGGVWVRLSERGSRTHFVSDFSVGGDGRIVNDRGRTAYSDYAYALCDTNGRIVDSDHAANAGYSHCRHCENRLATRS